MNKYANMSKVELEALLEQASDLYYNSDDKLMSDTEFDELKDFYESNYGDFKVGAPVREGKGTVNVEHGFGHLVGTLTKTNTIQQLKEWMEKTVKNAGGNPKKLKVQTSLKYDGNSVVIEFKDGKCFKALTRGRDGKGLDLTHVFKDVTIQDKRHVGVKFEVIMTWDDFERLNTDMNTSYKNPRSVTAGILGRDDAHKYVSYLTLVPLAYDVKGVNQTKLDELRNIKENFKDSKVQYLDGASLYSNDTLDDVIKSIEEEYNQLSKTRSELNYMIDGIVIELIGSEYTSLGWVNSKPKWTCALKFPYMECTSKVTGFDFCLGNSGKITPRVWFEPVSFNGATQTKVSLANYDRFQELKLGIGSDILIQYRNDCLSYAEKLNTENNKTIEPYPFTDKCPVCDGEVKITDTGAFAYCSNDVCPGKVVGRVERYMEKLDIKGIKAATIEKLHENGLINNIADMYKLDYKKVANIEGLGSKSATLMKKAIDDKKAYDYEVLAGLGIDGFGNTMAKTLCKFYSVKELVDMADNGTLYSNLINMEGFSDISINKLKSGIKSMKDELLDILELSNAKTYKDTVVTPQGATYTFCITGTVTQYKNRDELKKILEELGHKVTGSVTSKTDYLVNNDIDSTSGKNKKAKELGKPIIDENKLKELLGL